jgi:lathosterol oxidase
MSLPNERSRDWADLVDAMMLVLLTGAGLLCPHGPLRFYAALLVGFFAISASVVGGAFVAAWLAAQSHQRLQGPRRRPALYLRGARDTTLASWVAACFLAWPLARMWSGAPTGLVWTVDAAGGGPRLALSTVAAVLVLDAWLYWKHRLLHTRTLFGFHRSHHVYRDPTPLAGFAVGPVESVLTFWPISLVTFPQAVHYAPVYFGLVIGFVLLNFYLHCGVAWSLLERVLPRVYLNTSVFHNRHHANADVNFGEAFTIWDHVMRTRDGAPRGASDAGEPSGRPH